MTVFLILVVIGGGVALIALVLSFTSRGTPNPEGKLTSATNSTRQPEKVLASPIKRSARPTQTGSSTPPREVAFYIDKEQIDTLASASEFFPPHLALLLQAAWEADDVGVKSTMHQARMEYADYLRVGDAISKAHHKVTEEQPKYDFILMRLEARLGQSDRYNQWAQKPEAERTAILNDMEKRYSELLELEHKLMGIDEIIALSSEKAD